MKKGNVVFELDDVLIERSPAIYRLIRYNWSRFNRWFIDFGSLTAEDVYNRKFDNFYEWLLKPVFRNLSLDTFTQVIVEIEKIFSDRVVNQIYCNTNITEFARRTLMNETYINSPTIENVFILSSYSTDVEREQKEDLIKTYFKHYKITPVLYNINDGPIKAITDMKLSWELFVTTSPDLIKILSELSENNRKEFLLPKYPYIDIPNTTRALVEFSGGSINMYDPFVKN